MIGVVRVLLSSVRLLLEDSLVRIVFVAAPTSQERLFLSGSTRTMYSVDVLVCFAVVDVPLLGVSEYLFFCGSL